MELDIESVTAYISIREQKLLLTSKVHVKSKNGKVKAKEKEKEKEKKGSGRLDIRAKKKIVIQRKVV
jgi:hypothetical protein